MPGTEEVRDELMDDIFSAAFDEEIKGGSDEPKDEGGATKVVEEAEKKAAEEAASAAKSAEEAAAATKAAEEASAKSSEPNPEVLALKAQLEETNKKIKEREEAETAAKASEEAAKKAAPDPIEQEAWEKFKTDWPDQAAVIEKERNKTATEISELKKMLSELSENLKTQIAPVVASVAETEQDKFMQPILAAHPDAVELHTKGDLKAWIDKQPRYLQAGYNFALSSDQATPQDVIEVFTAYKEAIGVAKKDEPSAEEAAKQAAAKAAEEARLKKMELPTGVRTSVTTEDDPDDFDTAFEQEMKKLNK